MNINGKPEILIDPLVRDLQDFAGSLNDAQVKAIGDLLDDTQLSALTLMVELSIGYASSDIATEHHAFLLSLRSDQVEKLADVLAEEQLRHLMGVSRSASA